MNESSTAIRGPAPLLIGVTGHKDLYEDERDSLRTSVKAALEDLLRAMNVSPEEARILTGLAEGADTLVAEVALDLGIPLVPVLPMSADVYLEEFSSPHAVAVFQGLISRAAMVVELPLEEGVTSASVSLSANKGAFSPARNQQYAALGRCLALNADALVALWDGTPADPSQLGGTGHVVSMFMSRCGIVGAKLTSGALNPLDPGVLLHCKVSRKKTGRRSDSGVVEVSPIASGGDPDQEPDTQPWLATGMRDVLGHLIQERESAIHPKAVRVQQLPDFSSEANKSGQWMLPESARGKITLTETEGIALSQFGTADTLAIYFQRRRDRFLWVLISLGFAAALFAGLYSDSPYYGGNSVWFLLGFFLSLVSGYVVYQFKKGSRLRRLKNWFRRVVSMRKEATDPETAFEDYRALAEGMRVQFFWHLAGVNECVADHFLARQKAGLGWVRNALRFFHLELLVASSITTDEARLRQKVAEEHWVRSQRDWFQRKQDLMQRRIRRMRRSALLFFSLGLAMGGLLMGNHLRPFVPDEFAWVLRFLMAALPVFAGLIRFYMEITGIEETCEQYERIIPVYERAISMLESRDRRPSKGEVFFQLGREALAEHGDWLLFHRKTEVRAVS